MSFKTFLLDRKSIIFTFGRFNVMHTEHQQLFKDMEAYRRKHKIDEAVVYTSFVSNAKKNPLRPQDKILYLKKILPQGVRVSEDDTLKNSFQILEDLIKNKKYTNIIFMVGSDRFKDFNNMNKYARQWGVESEQQIQFKIVQRKNNRTTGISGTVMRELIKTNNFNEFKKHLPKTLHRDAKDIFKKAQIGLNIKGKNV